MYNYLYSESKESLEKLFESLPQRMQGALIGMNIMLEKLKDQRVFLDEEYQFADDKLEEIRYEMKLQGFDELYDFLKMELYENFLAFLERE